MKQKTFFEMASTCDKVIDKFSMKGDAETYSVDEAKVLLNAIGKKTKIIATQLDYARGVGITVSKKDFDFVYKGE